MRVSLGVVTLHCVRVSLGVVTLYICCCVAQEVFKSDFQSVAQFSQVVGKVCVLFIRDYLKFHPEVLCVCVCVCVCVCTCVN